MFARPDDGTPLRLSVDDHQGVLARGRLAGSTEHADPTDAEWGRRRQPASVRGILVIGHSHVGAIRHAAIRRRQAGGLPYMVRTINLFDPRFGDPSRHRFDADNIPIEFLAEVRRIIAKRQPLVCTAIGGNDHTMLTLNRSDRPWDFELLGEPSPPLDPHATIISQAEAHARLAAAMKNQLGAMARLRAEIGPFWQIESPPPVASPAFIAAHVETYFTDQPEYGRNGISPIGLRYRAWRLSCRIFAQQCRKLGCGYVRLPAAVFDDRGCLDERLAGDSTHGNIEFGQHVLEELDRLASLPGWRRNLRRVMGGAGARRGGSTILRPA